MDCDDIIIILSFSHKISGSDPTGPISVAQDTRCRAHLHLPYSRASYIRGCLLHGGHEVDGEIDPTMSHDTDDISEESCDQF